MSAFSDIKIGVPQDTVLGPLEHFHKHLQFVNSRSNRSSITPWSIVRVKYADDIAYNTPKEENV